ncbi:hypothetical protein IV203_024531 [Nitzschia inconspicua]|uniref:Uncharacterized protein n=1 Tax=Nitzschia inconspicua TaxID=303405 RepID=A0A9K3K8E0_9STRA|nr:hypothetical protein IV203_024531 [Nitzschia inconspicua]
MLSMTNLIRSQSEKSAIFSSVTQFPGSLGVVANAFQTLTSTTLRHASMSTQHFPLLSILNGWKANGLRTGVFDYCTVCRCKGRWEIQK